MSFTNASVDLASLPKFDEAPLERLDSRYPPLVLVVALIVEAPLAIAAAAFVLLVPPITLPFRISIACAALAVLGLVAWLSYRRARAIRYAVREHDVILRTGLFWRKETVQPIRRIQHVEQVQGPLDKRLGLSTVRLFSAGTGNVTLRVPGLDAATADALSRYILSANEAARGGPPASREPPVADMGADG